MADMGDSNRRDFLGLAGKAGVTTMFAQAVGVNLGMVNVAQAQSVSPFSFAIIADPHLYSPKDHVFDKQLEDAVSQVNAMATQPDFVMVMGDVAHHGELDQLEKGKRILSKLKVPIRSIPGEHDWYLDMGAGWKANFGDEFWSFDHKGVHFIGMNSILVPDFWTSAGLTCGSDRPGECSCDAQTPAVQQPGADSPVVVRTTAYFPPLSRTALCRSPPRGRHRTPSVRPSRAVLRRLGRGSHGANGLQAPRAAAQPLSVGVRL